jgi:hypothetical protein
MKHSAFFRYLRRNGNILGQCISCLKTSRRGMIHLGWWVCVISSLSVVFHETATLINHLYRDGTRTDKFNTKLGNVRTQFMYMFRMIIRQCTHTVYVYVPYDYSAMCAHILCICSVWLFGNVRTQFMYMFRMILRQCAHTVYVYVPYDSSAMCAHSICICSVWLFGNVRTQCMYMFRMTLTADSDFYL